MNTPGNLHIDYSLKNIPVISEFYYKKLLTSKIELLLTRMRWKLWHFQNKRAKKRLRETFGFKTPNSPPAMKELRPFEDDVIELIRNVEFRKSTNPLQEKMKKDIVKINETPCVIVQADKTDDYNKYLVNNITEEYKKAGDLAVEGINVEAAKFAKELELDDRVEGIAKKAAYLTVKDHKEDFPARMKFRVINPAKTNLGKVSKSIVERINAKVKAAIGVNQWINTGEVLDWFNGLENKKNLKWLKFDIVNYYPSITEGLLMKALHFAKQFTPITDEEIDLILHCRKSVLVGKDGSLWIKKDNANFDVAMGSYDSAEICDLCGLFLLWRIGRLIPELNVGLYRDDGLSTVVANGQDMERISKKLHKLFKEEGLNITTEVNVTTVDFLDVLLDLQTGSYKPFTKPNANTKYVSPQSNHPPSIIANIPEAINTRLCNISSSQEMFEAEVDYYQNALNNAGYNVKLEYKEDQNMASTQRKKN